MAIARLPLPLLLLLLLLLVGGSSGEEAEVVCAGAACYTLHRAQLGWNDAQKRCHHNGGKLAPAHSPAEARRLQELLEGAGWTGPAWIGLSLPRGHCVQPQEPLRGFSWVAGEEAGNYSAWLSEPAVTCLSARCVSLKLAGPAGSPGWAAHPCRTPLPAFLCKFIFQGMCGPLPLAGPGRVTYDTPFGVRSPQLAAAPFGTLAEAHCEAGGSPAFALCKKLEQGDGFAWHPPGPLCPAACAHRNGGCQHRCLEAPGEPPRCACHPGYTLAPDMASCLPEDACHPNPCQETCRPGGPRGFECSCKAGYDLAPDGRHCLDVDECLARPCQHECHNTAGSFVCLCPPGYHDACVDVDECLRDPCPGTCHNLPGDFKCLCPHGFLPEEDGHGCRAAPTAGEEPVPRPVREDGTALGAGRQQFFPRGTEPHKARP
uniref:CD93 molecule n=1 Tax=Calidris pygmaea TaxID=425635 RepID=A0A8C3KAN2_9CHAR